MVALVELLIFQVVEAFSKTFYFFLSVFVIDAESVLTYLSHTMANPMRETNVGVFIQRPEFFKHFLNISLNSATFCVKVKH